MARSKYGFNKRQKELDRKKKKELKRQRKIDKITPQAEESDTQAQSEGENP